MVRLSYIALVFVMCLVKSFAQVDAFATIKLNRTEVYPEQPIKATITVSTATWFTAPLTFDNLQVLNAFVIPFKRTLSTQIERNGKSYPSLQFYYLIYPYQSGSYEVPELIIQIESPVVGDYKGVSSTLKTKAVAFSVKEPPSSFKATWFIASNVSIEEQWNSNIEKVKVGDVIEREIRVNATGTLPSFIPPIEFEEVNSVSVYDRSPTLNDKRNNQTANGERIDRSVYLFEKEGEIEIPEVRIDWWNPYQQKAYFKRIPARKVVVLPNPDLGMITSVRDSLNVVNGRVEEGIAGAPRTVLGLKPWQFFLVVVLLIILIRKVYQFTVKQVIDIRARRKRYLHSEQYYFQRIIRYKGTDALEFQSRVYKWWDTFRIPLEIEGSLSEELTNDDLRLLWQSVMSKQSPLIYQYYRQHWKDFREEMFNRKVHFTKHFSNLQTV